MLGFPKGEIGLVFVSDGRMRALNRRYRKLDQTTDVLSFPLQEFHQGKRKPRLQKTPLDPLGDVVISIPMALKQARTQGKSVDHEIMTLLTHGVLHLVGYDHEASRVEEKRMRSKEMAFHKTLTPRLPALTH
jgi:rRNA maturation RNase YbeY